MVELGTLITQAKTVRCGESNYPVLSMTMHDGLVLQDDRFKKVIASKDKSDYKVVYRDQLVISFPIDEGVLATQRITDAGIVSPAYGIWDVDQEKVVPEFLEYALRCERSIAYYKAKLRGSTARRRSLPTPTLLAHTVPLPSIEEQKYVLDLIHKVETIIHLRKDELKELDALTKARFIEMFGDVGTGAYNYKTCKLGDVAKVGSSHRVFTTEFVENGIPFYRGTEIGELADGQEPSDPYYISEEHYERLASDDTKPLVGDLLMPSICNKGQVWMVDTEQRFYYKDGRVLCISPDRILFNSKFLQYFMREKTLVEYPKMGSGSTFAEFKIFLLKDMDILVPPREIQDKFADFVNQVDKSKAAVQKSLDETQVLFDSLMQKYFG